MPREEAVRHDHVRARQIEAGAGVSSGVQGTTWTAVSERSSSAIRRLYTLPPVWRAWMSGTRKQTVTDDDASVREPGPSPSPPSENG